MIAHALGEQLGKTLGEIAALPYWEVVSWVAYFELKRD